MRAFFLLILAGSWWGWAAIGEAQSPAAVFRQAAVEYQTRNWTAASTQFASLIADFPDAVESREAWFYLGEARTQLGELEAAAAAYRNFLLLSGNHPHREKARFRLAEQAYLQGASDAVTQAESFLQVYPGSQWQPEVLAYLGQLRLQRAEPQLAERVLATALTRFPDHGLADENRLGLAAAQMRLGVWEPAERLLKDLEQRRNDGLGQRARVLLALLELEAGDRRAARERLEAVLASGSVAERQAAEVRFWLARIEAGDQNHPAAAELYLQAIRGGLVEPQLSAALTEWAAARLKTGSSAVAVEELRALQEAPAAKAWNRTEREIVLALETRLAYEAGHWAAAALAAETYRVSYPAGPSYRQVAEIAGRAAYAQGDYETAARQFEELLRTPGVAAAERANYGYQLACQQVASKQFAAARETLEQLPPDHLSAELAWLAGRLMATALEGEGRPDAALQRLEQLAAGQPPGGAGMQRYLLRQLLQLALKQDAFAIVSARWPEFLALGGPTKEELGLVQRVADLAYRQRDWALATDGYRQLARTEWSLETQAVGWAGLAWTAMAEQRQPAAREAFETLVGLPVAEERKAEAYLPLGNLLDAAGERIEAIEMYQRAINHAGAGEVQDVARFKAGIALHQLGTGNSLAEAYDLLQSLARESTVAVPEDQLAYRLAWVEEDLGRALDAQQRFVRFLGEFPESPLRPDVVFRVASAELQRGDSVAAGKRLATVDPDELPPELRERILFLAGQVAAVERRWDRVLEKMEPLAGSASDLGLRDKAGYWAAEALFQSGEYLRALEAFTSLLDQEPLRLAANHRTGAELRRIECLVALEKWPAALAALEQFPQETGESHGEPAALERQLLRGRVLVAMGELSEALGVFERVVSEAGPDSQLAAQAQWRVGETRLAQEDYEKALAAYESTLGYQDAPQWQAAALLQAGKCEERLGNRTAALRRYRELIERFPESEFAPTARRRVEALDRRARNDELIRR